MATTAEKKPSKYPSNDLKLARAKKARAVINRIDAEFVTRVGDRVGKGLTLEQSLILEEQDVESASFLRLLSKRPDFCQIYRLRQAKFLESALEIIQAGDSKDVRRLQGFQWILERRHREQFGREPSVQINNNMIVNGVPVDAMGQLRSRVSQLSRGATSVCTDPTESTYMRKKRERLAARALIEQQGKVIDVQEVKVEPAKVEK